MAHALDTTPHALDTTPHALDTTPHVLDITPGDRLLRLADVCATVGFRTTKIYEMIKDGEFPPPVKLGRSSRWRQSEIIGWIQRQ